MAQFGVSFTPGQNGEDVGQARGPADRLQRAIQILSLRLPRRPNIQGALAPTPLLQARGGFGSPFGRGAVAQTQQQQPGGGLNPVIQALLQLSGMGPQMGAPMMPRVIPGLGSSDPVVGQAKQANVADYYNSQPGGLAGAQTDFAQTSPYGPGSGHPKYGGQIGSQGSPIPTTAWYGKQLDPFGDDFF